MFVSILGDSISTYEGFQLPGYAVFYQDYYRQVNELTSVYDIWWAKVNQYLRAYICVNNAYSGSKVTGTAFPCACSEQRTGVLHTVSDRPDMILIYMGFNDFGAGEPVWGKWYAPEQGITFYGCYRRMLRQLKANDPQAKIVCATLMRGFVRGAQSAPFPERFAGVPFEDYNAAIRKAAQREGALLADLAALNWRYETLDGTHPTANGHKTLANAWIKCLAPLLETGLP